jgi:serine/threonine protein kinase
MLLIENCNNNIIRNNKQKQDSKKEKIINKKDLQNITNLQEYFKNNHLKFYNQLENFEFLDSGGESNVYNVTFKESKKKCVMKLIINDLREKRNYKEINISKKLKHKNIIDLLYHTQLNNTESDIIIMENASLGNLRNFL